MSKLYNHLSVSEFQLLVPIKTMLVVLICANCAPVCVSSEDFCDTTNKRKNRLN